VLVAAAAVVLLDQSTKSLALRFLPPAGAAGSRQLGMLRLTTNSGSWLARGPSVPALAGLWLVTLACTVLALAAGAGDLGGAGLLVALGGATGNLLDRVRRGAVIDFIALGRWPAFNLADVAIVTGVAAALASVV
jgi:signal peptidase II